MDLYAIVGVSRGAPMFEIKTAWRKLAKTLHPDAGGDAQRFAAAALAAEVLLDEAKRAEYDATGRTDFSTVAPDSAAFALLTQVFAELVGEWVQGAMSDNTDLIARVRRKLDNRARDQRLQIAQMRRIERRATDALSRLGRDEALGADPLRTMLAERVAQLGELIPQAERQAVDHERAAELALQWTWRADVAPGAPVRASSGTASTSFSVGGA